MTESMESQLVNWSTVVQVLIRSLSLPHHPQPLNMHTRTHVDLTECLSELTQGWPINLKLSLRFYLILESIFMEATWALSQRKGHQKRKQRTHWPVSQPCFCSSPELTTVSSWTEERVSSAVDSDCRYNPTYRMPLGWKDGNVAWFFLFFPWHLSFPRWVVYSLLIFTIKHIQVVPHLFVSCS